MRCACGRRRMCALVAGLTAHAQVSKAVHNKILVNKSSHNPHSDFSSHMSTGHHTPCCLISV